MQLKRNRVNKEERRRFGSDPPVRLILMYTTEVPDYDRVSNRLEPPTHHRFERIRSSEVEIVLTVRNGHHRRLSHSFNELCDTAVIVTLSSRYTVAG
jgi:hypothetical protein